jgi:AcrR family transcriptional regulator
VESTQKAPVRERLLETADRLFYAEGIRAVGIDRVLAESQVAKSTMYVHFRTKEELVEAYLRRRTDTWRAYVEGEIEVRATGPADQILAVFEVFDERLSRPDYRGCPFGNAAAEYPTHEGIQAAIDHHRAWLPGLFARLLDRPADDHLVAALVQLSDGAQVTAHLDRASRAARTARSTAALLLAASGVPVAPEHLSRTR